MKKGIQLFILFFISVGMNVAALEPEYARNGMVVSPEPHAAKVGVEILKSGGNAFDAAAAMGFALAVIYTLNGAYGMGAVVDGAGFLLNNEMDDFTAKLGEPNMFGLVQGKANAIEPGKRMLSSMTPAIVTKDGEFKLTFGSPGGPTIITTDLQIFLNCVEWEMNIREAITAPRFHHQWLPDVITHERYGFSPDSKERLREMGYALEMRESIGIAGGIEALDDGILAGYADGRGIGKAKGY